MAVRVVIAENDPERRSLFRAHLQTIPAVEVVGYAPDEERAVGLCDELRPELVLMSLDDDRSIDSAIAQLKMDCPDVKVLVITPPGTTIGPSRADAVLTRPVESDTFVATLVELCSIRT